MHDLYGGVIARLGEWRRAGALAAAAGLAVGLAGGGRAQGPPGAGGGRPPAVAETVPIEGRQVRDEIALIGVFEPVRESRVAAEVAGRVEAFLARDGQVFADGAVLARIRSDTWQIMLRAADAQLAEARAEYEQATKDLARARELFDQDVVSIDGLETAQTRQSTWAQRLARNEAEIERLRERLDRTEVRAPFAGTVAAEHTEVGEWVGEGDPVADLVDLSRLRFTVGVPERLIGQLHPADAVPIEVPALADEIVTGRIKAILPRADAATRTFPVEVEVENSGGRILAGMTGRARFAVGAPRAALTVPKDAIVSQGGGHVVYAFEQGLARRVPVQLGIAQGGWIEVIGELEAGTTVVVRGNERLMDGQPVQASPSPPPTGPAGGAPAGAVR